MTGAVGDACRALFRTPTRAILACLGWRSFSSSGCAERRVGAWRGRALASFCAPPARPHLPGTRWATPPPFSARNGAAAALPRFAWLVGGGWSLLRCLSACATRQMAMFLCRQASNTILIGTGKPQRIKTYRGK